MNQEKQEQQMQKMSDLSDLTNQQKNSMLGAYAAYDAYRNAGMANMNSSIQNSIYAQQGIYSSQVLPLTIDQQIAAQKQQLRILENRKLQELAPTVEHMEDYPAMKEAWDAYMVIRNLTIGNE